MHVPERTAHDLLGRGRMAQHRPIGARNFAALEGVLPTPQERILVCELGATNCCASPSRWRAGIIAALTGAFDAGLGRPRSVDANVARATARAIEQAFGRPAAPAGHTARGRTYRLERCMRQETVVTGAGTMSATL
jgi:hypothetical protein